MEPTEAKITHVYTFPNGMVIVFDQFGKQMPEYQGRVEEVIPKIIEAGFPIDQIREGVWRR
jgi:hypothetical protein